MSTSIYVLERRQSSTCRTLVISCPWGHQVINWRLSLIAIFAHKADILVRRALITRQGKRNILLYYFLRDIFFIPKSKINILPANKIKSLKIFSSKRFLRQSFKRNWHLGWHFKVQFLPKNQRSWEAEDTTTLYEARISWTLNFGQPLLKSNVIFYM